jgi:hypothetical protein
MNTLWRVPAFALLAFSSSAWAQCSLVLGAGQSKVTGISTLKYEDRLFAEKVVSGGHLTDGTSRTTRFGLQCPINRTFDWALDYREGFRVQVASQGMVRDSSVQANFAFQRFGEARGYGLSTIGRLPVSEQLSLTGRAGVLVGIGAIGLSSGDISLAQEKRGYLPILGLGLRYDGGRSWFLHLEGTRYTWNGRVREITLGLGYKFY